VACWGADSSIGGLTQTFSTSLLWEDGEELLPEWFGVRGRQAVWVNSCCWIWLIPGVYVPQFYDMASDGSVHPNHKCAKADSQTGGYSHASLLDWVGTITWRR